MNGMCVNENAMLVAIPEEYEVKLPNPDLLDFYNERKDRNIYLNFDIDDSVFDITKQIIEYNRQDNGIPVDERKPIHLYIMSYGGDLYQGWTLISTIMASTTPVHTVNMGVAMSCGFLVLLAGHKRFAMKHSTAMCHQGSGSSGGTYDQMEESQKNYKKIMEEMRDYIIERTNIDTKLFKKNQSKDWYMTDIEQVEFGVVDGIVNNIDEII